MTKKRFRPASNVKWAKLLPYQPPWITRKRSRGRYAMGVRYEKTFQAHMASLVQSAEGLQYLESPWLEFEDDSGRRWCQADGILLDKGGKGIIYEVKYQHTLEAWWQLTWLYEPVVRRLYPDVRFGRMEVVRWHDPAVVFPEGYDLTRSPLSVPNAARAAVHIFNPRGKGAVSSAGHSRSKGDSALSDQTRPEGTLR